MDKKAFLEIVQTDAFNEELNKIADEVNGDEYYDTPALKREIKAPIKQTTSQQGNKKNIINRMLEGAKMYGNNAIDKTKQYGSNLKTDFGSMKTDFNTLKETGGFLNAAKGSFMNSMKTSPTLRNTAIGAGAGIAGAAAIGIGSHILNKRKQNRNNGQVVINN